MPATPDERKQFGQLLRARREEAGLTGADLANQLTHAGHPTSRQNISGWETGRYAPRQRLVVLALERILGAADGELAAELGLVPNGRGNERLDRLEAGQEELRREVADLAKLVRQLGTPRRVQRERP